MKIFKIMGWSSALCLSAMSIQAQETNEVGQLKKQLQQMQESFDKVQREQKQQLDLLMKQIEGLQKNQTAVTAEQEKLKQEMARPIAEAAPSIVPEQKPWSPASPIQLFGSGQNYINLSFDGLFTAGTSTADDIGELQPGGHDPKQRGFTVQNLETVFEGKIDPYLRGQANIVLQIDPGGETIIEAEEAYLETMSLPWNMQIKAGQYFTEFGRLNPSHPHSWDFVDQPLVNNRFLGPDGIRNPGARLSWLTPTPFYSEFFLGMQNSQGETATSFRSAGGHSHGGEEEEGALPFAYRHPDNDRGVHGFDDMLFAPRYAVSFDVTESQTVLMGASALFGPNSSGQSGDTDTQIYGMDFKWKWKSPNHNGGFPFVSWQTEVMLRKFRVGAFDWDEEGNLGDGDDNTFPDEGVLVNSATGLPAVLGRETLTDYGFYSQFSYGFKKGWVAGLRFDYLNGDRGDYEKLQLILADNAGGGEAAGLDPQRLRRWRISPNMTWYPSEFSKIRLQYNYDDRQKLGVDHSVWLQFEFLLGSHSAHKF